MKKSILLILLIFTFLPLVNGQKPKNTISTEEIYNFIQLLIVKNNLNKRRRLILSPAKSCSINGTDSLFLSQFLIDSNKKIDTSNIFYNPITNGYDTAVLAKAQRVRKEAEEIKIYIDKTRELLLDTTDIYEEDTTNFLNNKDSLIRLRLNDFMFTLSTASSFPEKPKLLTTDDINFMLQTRREINAFKWDNKKLNFNLKNKEWCYEISIPLFSKDKTQVIVRVSHFCSEFLCGGGDVYLFTKNRNDWDVKTIDSWWH
jgi:hypothetical protein